MIDSCGANENKPPVFSEDGQWFKVTFTRIAIPHTINCFRTDRVLSAIASNPVLTQKSLSEITGMPVSAVKRILTDLNKDEIIARRGSDRKGEWVIIRGTK